MHYEVATLLLVVMIAGWVWVRREQRDLDRIMAEFERQNAEYRRLWREHTGE